MWGELWEMYWVWTLQTGPEGMLIVVEKMGMMVMIVQVLMVLMVGNGERGVGMERIAMAAGSSRCS